MEAFSEFAAQRNQFSNFLQEVTSKNFKTKPLPKKEEPNPLIVLRKELEQWHENKAKQLQEYEELMKQQKIDNENLEMLVGLFSYHLLR
eukprot:UN26151